jgi:hypothetical protein
MAGGLQKGSISFCGAPLGAPIGGSARIWGGGLRGWISLGTLKDDYNGVVEVGYLHGSSFKGTWRRTPLLRVLKVYERKAPAMDGGSVGEPVTSTSTGYFEIWLRRALVVGCLSLWELWEGNLGWELPCWGP